MKKYGADGTAPVLKTATQEIQPVVEKHLARAKDIKKTM